MQTAPGALRNLIGAAMSLRRDIFERVGGFRDELGRVGSMPFGCEETELCIRANQAIPGGIFRYQPSARVRHRVGPERTRFAYFRRQCFNEGRGKALMARGSAPTRGSRLNGDTRCGCCRRRSWPGSAPRFASAIPPACCGPEHRHGPALRRGRLRGDDPAAPPP